MEINKNKQQRELERFFMAPSLRPFLGVTLTKETDIEDEFEMTSEDGKHHRKVQQKIKGTVLVTEIEYTEELEGGMSLKEEVRTTYNLTEGMRLIWEEGQGYMALQEGFQTLEEIEENYKLLKE